MELRKFNVKVCRFDPAKGVDSGEVFLLPVDCPDEEHAASATIANAVNFTPLTQGSTIHPVAFCCLGVLPRE